MENLTNDCCRVCLAWDRKTMTCHLHPPVLVGFTTTSSGEKRFEWAWPKVRPEHWCLDLVEG
jgi:hypothetical protein